MLKITHKNSFFFCSISQWGLRWKTAKRTESNEVPSHFHSMLEDAGGHIQSPLLLVSFLLATRVPALKVSFSLPLSYIDVIMFRS